MFTGAGMILALSRDLWRLRFLAFGRDTVIDIMSAGPQRFATGIIVSLVSGTHATADDRLC